MAYAGHLKLLLAGIMSSVLLCPLRKRRYKAILSKLPDNLSSWRVPIETEGVIEAEEKIWEHLEPALQDRTLPVFQDRNFTFWTHIGDSTLVSPGQSLPLASGFAYAEATRGVVGYPSHMINLSKMQYANPLMRLARTSEGHDVVIRVIQIKNEGASHLKILRQLATGPNSLLANNHALPLLNEIQFGHITFGIFPKAGGSLRDAYGGWAKNSVGDILEMIMQALEGLAFIHEHRVAHRDAFQDNFVLQWHPESLRSMTIAASRPRVYIIDFEAAVDFGLSTVLEPCLAKGIPLAGSFTKPEFYGRPAPPEVIRDMSYNPFKLDVWQLGQSFSDFRSTIPAIDEVLDQLTHPDSALRVTAQEAIHRLGNIIHNTAPEDLLLLPGGSRQMSFAMRRVVSDIAARQNKNGARK